MFQQVAGWCGMLFNDFHLSIISMLEILFKDHFNYSGVYLCGHSAGGQLAAMMLAVDWLEERMHSNSQIKGHDFTILLQYLFTVHLQGCFLRGLYCMHNKC